MPNRTSMCFAPALAAAMLLSACGGKSEAPGQGAGPGGAMPPAEVGYIVAQPADIVVKAEAAGRLTPYHSADVRARIPGIVQRRLYDEGSDVQVGQVLFRIDPAQLQADSSAAQAALARAQAEAANASASAARARPPASRSGGIRRRKRALRRFPALHGSSPTARAWAASASPR